MYSVYSVLHVLKGKALPRTKPYRSEGLDQVQAQTKGDPHEAKSTECMIHSGVKIST